MPGKKNIKASIAWNGFEGEEAILPVCVRSLAVKTRVFEATCRALSERVKKVHLILCDTLDRYNLPEAETRRLSEEWRKANLPVLSRHIPDHDVHVWDEVRAAPAFPERHQTMQKLYDLSDNAREIVDRIADFYLTAKARRCLDQDVPFDRAHERLNSIQYLIEEFAGTAEYASWYPGLPEAYWGSYMANPHAFEDERLVLPVTLPVTVQGLPEPAAG